MSKIQSTLSKYEKYLQNLEVEEKKQLSKVQEERGKCRISGVNCMEYGDYVFESRDLNAIRNKRLLIIQLIEELKEIQEEEKDNLKLKSNAKSIPVSEFKDLFHNEFWYVCYECPNCGCDTIDIEVDEYCKGCGLKIEKK